MSSQKIAGSVGKSTSLLIGCCAALLLATPALAARDSAPSMPTLKTSQHMEYVVDLDRLLAGRGKGHGYGPGDGTGNGGVGPGDGSGNGPGDCSAAVVEHLTDHLLLARGGNGGGGNGAGNGGGGGAGNGGSGENGGHGPGDGTGNDGVGPEDGTGFGPGDCTLS